MPKQESLRVPSKASSAEKQKPKARSKSPSISSGQEMKPLGIKTKHCF